MVNYDQVMPSKTNGNNRTSTPVWPEQSANIFNVETIDKLVALYQAKTQMLLTYAHMNSQYNEAKYGALSSG